MSTSSPDKPNWLKKGALVYHPSSRTLFLAQRLLREQGQLKVSDCAKAVSPRPSRIETPVSECVPAQKMHLRWCQYEGKRHPIAPTDVVEEGGGLVADEVYLAALSLAQAFSGAIYQEEEVEFEPETEPEFPEEALELDEATDEAISDLIPTPEETDEEEEGQAEPVPEAGHLSPKEMFGQAFDPVAIVDGWLKTPEETEPEETGKEPFDYRQIRLF